ncbi:MAG: tyrosine-type recombinase/integrase [Deltaproteobacteria bacterium]|nr:tyrosine-type recombinase/integrase [Deltaproteobacteria bacterium]
MILCTMKLERHANGTYYLRYSRTERYSLKTKDAKLAQKLFKTKEREFLEGRVQEIRTGIKERRTLAEFWEEYQEHRFQTASKFSQQTDRQAFRVFLAELGADTYLTQLTTKLIEKARDRIAKRVSQTSANTWFRHFKAALGKATAWGYLKTSPAVGIKRLNPQEDFPRWLTEEEFSRLLAAENDPEFRLFWIFQVYGGARRSESLGVNAKDVHCRLHRINIGKTKNRKPKFIIINDQVRRVLWELLPEVGRLFPWRPDTVSHHFKATARAAGLDCRLHDLRHTYGSWLAMRGVPLHTIGKLMGHQDTKTTQIYAHLSQEHLEEAAGKL